VKKRQERGKSQKKGKRENENKKKEITTEERLY